MRLKERLRKAMIKGINESFDINDMKNVINDAVPEKRRVRKDARSLQFIQEMRQFLHTLSASIRLKDIDGNEIIMDEEYLNKIEKHPEDIVPFCSIVLVTLTFGVRSITISRHWKDYPTFDREHGWFNDYNWFEACDVCQRITETINGTTYHAHLAKSDEMYLIADKLDEINRILIFFEIPPIDHIFPSDDYVPYLPSVIWNQEYWWWTSTEDKYNKFNAYYLYQGFLDNQADKYSPMWAMPLF